MASDQIANYLQVLRKKSGFTQSELALVLGLISEWQVSRHERSLGIPGLLVALGYEALFSKPISDIFPGFYRTVAKGVDERLLQLERQLQDSPSKGRKAEPVARKLEFMWERRNPETTDVTQIH